MGAKLGILAAALAVLGSHYSMSSKLSIADTTATIADSQYEVLARNAALTGLHRAKQRLVSDFSSTTITGTSESISYETQIDVTGDIAAITSTGYYKTDFGTNPASYVIKADYDRTGGGFLPGGILNSLSYALMAEESLELSGHGGAATIHVPGVATVKLNANVHTNGDLDVQGDGSAKIHGFGTYSGSVSGDYLSKFQPNFNPAGLDPVYQVPRVEIPEVDIPDILTHVTPDLQLPLGLLAGTQVFPGTSDNPTIIHVPGDLTISGLISGYVVFLVEGTVTVVGSALAGFTGNLGKEESNLAFYAMGDFVMEGNAEAWGQILVNGDFTMGGSSVVYGTITVGGKATITETPHIYYREASETLTEILDDTPLGSEVAMVSYGEF